MAVVDQEIVLFNDTIANNIRLWDTSIEDYEVILAARDAGIHEVIMQRDGGYNAVLSEGGARPVRRTEAAHRYCQGPFPESQTAGVR